MGTQQRVRIRYSKRGRLKFVGHNDLLRALESLFRRARLPLAMSGGFHPKVKMSFPGALPLGFESSDEVLDLEFRENAEIVNTEKLLEELNRQSLEGLVFLSASTLKEGDKKVFLKASVYQLYIPVELRKQTKERMESFLAETSVIVKKPNGKPVDVRSAIEQFVFEEPSGLLTVSLISQNGPEAGVRELLTALGLEKELFVSLFPLRICSRIAADIKDGQSLGGL